MSYTSNFLIKFQISSIIIRIKFYFHEIYPKRYKNIEKIVNSVTLINYSSFFRFCAFRFLFLRKNPKNKKAKYISKLMPKIKTIFEISINDFFNINYNIFCNVLSMVMIFHLSRIWASIIKLIILFKSYASSFCLEPLSISWCCFIINYSINYR